MTLYEELKARGLVAQITDEEIIDLINNGKATFYIGFDCTADSLTAGHFMALTLMKRLQMAGNKPIALIGGGTTMIGDPSGRTDMRKMLTKEDIAHNAACFKKQMEKFIDFSEGKALMLNNADWLLNLNYVELLRDVGACFSVNNMLRAKCYEQRMEKGLSFLEFNYMIMQSYDFYYMFQHYGCNMQFGGDDQWSNMLGGTELIRRKLGAEAYAITCPLITKADGTKFGKTESGNVWLDPRYTSPYKFYQFWLNVSDDDAKRYIKIFTLLDRATIDALVAEHDAAPHLRTLQKRLAEEITVMIHSREEYEKAVEASQILFGGATSEALRRLDEQTLLQVFEGVPQFTVARTELGLPFVDLCAAATQIFPSKGECRKMVQGGGVALNKEKVADAMRPVTEADLIAGKYLLVQRGKKNYYLVTVE